jgi:hypothetical protein
VRRSVRTNFHNSLDVEVKSIRVSLRSLDRGLRRLVPLLAVATKNGTEREHPRVRPRLSTKGRASLVLQGRYMGFMRQLKPKQKAQVRKVKESKGVRAAIAKAKEMR